MKTEVLLKNGSMESTPHVALIRLALERLFDTGFGSAVWELIQLCNDPGYRLFGPSKGKLAESGLLECPKDEYFVYGSVRNISLSATEGDAPETFKLVNPVAERKSDGGTA